MKTKTFKGITYGDHVVCNMCDETMLLPCGTDICPMCHTVGCLSWIDQDNPERDIADLDEIEISEIELGLSELLSDGI